MLKYIYDKEVFREIPDEISLAISISGCQILCPGCHSPELWSNKGKYLTWPVVKQLLQKHKGVTCLLLFGGEHSIFEVMEIFWYAHRRLKTAWYCGLQELPKQNYDILQDLDYIKLGPYRPNLGGLDSPTTNQRLYQLEHRDNKEVLWNDITYKLQGYETEQGTIGDARPKGLGDTETQKDYRSLQEI